MIQIFSNNRTLLLFLLLPVVMVSCDKYLPDARENIGIDSEIPVKTYTPVLGRNSVYSNIFSKLSTSYPATFKLVNLRRRSGDDAPELRTVVPVKVWSHAYTGEETSLEEIEAKREIQNRPVFEIGEHSGDLIFWNTANSNFIRALPDSGYLFDIEVSNSGGRRYFQDLQLQPLREVAYEPNSFDAYTGMQTSPYVHPNDIINVQVDTSLANMYMGNFAIDVTFNKIMDGNENKLTFRFLDRDNNFINPDKFTDTDWPGLVHGFNMEKTATGVSYDVAYPIPLARIPTKYTSNGGLLNRVMFRYRSLGFGNAIEENYFGLNFAIYEPGNWEIIFRFSIFNPKFD
ncbi:DUF5007 domain-containing protein [Niabella terrae]